MKAYIRHSMGRSITVLGVETHYHDNAEFDLSGDDLLTLFREGYDVMLTHHGKPLEPGRPLTVWLDDKGKRFHQR